MKSALRLSALFFIGMLCCMTASAQLLYRISGNGLVKPSYIFGTHHMAPLSVLDSVKGIDKAFDAAETVVGELEMADKMDEITRATLKYMPAPPDSTLTTLLSPEEFDKASARFEAIMGPSLKLSSFAGMKPMIISTVVTMTKIGESITHNPAEQLDLHFQQMARTQDKGVIGLETAEFQAQLLYTSTPISLQLKELLEILDNPDKLMADVADLNRLYMAQDIEGLYEMSAEDDTNPEFTAALIDRRNSNWLKQLPDIMSSGPAFIAVGALHLPGPRGVLEGLREAGYNVEAVR